jgi:hypothetical protein
VCISCVYEITCARMDGTQTCLCVWDVCVCVCERERERERDREGRPNP